MTAERTNASGNDTAFDAILAEYLEAVENGDSPDREAFKAKYPQYAQRLDEFFADQQRFARLAAPFEPRAVNANDDRPVQIEPTLDSDSAGDSRAAGDAVLHEPPDPMPGEFVRYFGDYELIQEIARGGMGVVYEAKQLSLNRMVALKMILAGQLATEAEVKRFHQEAEAAAHLDHPNIVPIHEVGQYKGRHYFTMKLVDGGPLSEHLARLHVDRRAAARIMAKVARAVHFAHQRGILHRDLKPANILLSRSELSAARRTDKTKGATAENCEPLVTDFGLAKRVDGQAGQTITNPGAILGTPAYMSPEQATGETQLTTATDIYSLGAILYVLLTGQPPFQGATPLEVLRQLVENEPVPPRNTDGDIPRDLETICLKCLEKDPTRRYGSAEACAQDLERWLDGKPIEARPVTATERLVKWARRQPLLAGSLATLVAAVLGLLILAGFLWQNAELRAQAVKDLGAAKTELAQVDAQRQQAETKKTQAETLADEQRKLADQQKALADKIAAEVRQLEKAAGAAQEKLVVAEQQARRTTYAADMQLAHVAWKTENMAALTELVRRYQTPGDQEDLRGFEWHYLNRQMRGAARSWPVDKAAKPEMRAVAGLVISPDGKTVATALTDGKIKLWSMSDGQLVQTIDAGKFMLAGLSFADEGRKLVAVVGQPVDPQLLDKTLIPSLIPSAIKKEKFNPRLLAEQLEFRTWTLNEASVPRVEPFDPARLRCTVFPLVSGVCLVPHEGHFLGVTSLSTSPDGKYLAVAGMLSQTPGGPAKVSDEISGGRLIVWDILQGEIHAEQKTPQRITAAVFSPDSRSLAIGYWDGAICVADPGADNPRQRLDGHHSGVNALRFNADGTRLASGAADGQVLVWDVGAGAGKETARLRGHTLSVTQAEFCPDGQTLVSAGADAVKVWDLEHKENPRVLRGSTGLILALAFSADGGELNSAHSSGAVSTWRVADGQLLRTAQVTSNLPSVLSSDGKSLTWQEGSGSDDFVVRDLASDKQCRVAWKGHTLLMPTLSRDDRLVAVRCIESGDLGVWDAADGKQLATLPGGRGLGVAHAFSPDGKSLAAVREKAVVLWDWRAGTSRRLLESKTAVFNRLAFADDNSQLAVVVGGDVVKLWDLSADRVRVECRLAGMGIVNVAFSPDGRRLATASVTAGQQGVLKLWDTISGREVFSAALPSLMPTAMALSPDGHRLAAAMAPVSPSIRSAPAEIYVWDATPVAVD